MIWLFDACKGHIYVCLIWALGDWIDCLKLWLVYWYVIYDIMVFKYMYLLSYDLSWLSINWVS
jgi:hypothetical protein